MLRSYKTEAEPINRSLSFHATSFITVVDAAKHIYLPLLTLVCSFHIENVILSTSK